MTRTRCRPGLAYATAGEELWKPGCCHARQHDNPSAQQHSREASTIPLVSWRTGSGDAEAEWYEFVGHVPPARLTEMYAKSILVFPSHIETLGLPLLEARAAGCRIVASDIAAAREALAEHNPVHYMAPRSAEDLARRMCEAWAARRVGATRSPAAEAVASSVGSPWRRMVETLDELKGSAGR